ncbi:MAG TPA: SpoIIE family protein phosphatase [Thermoanaerobaculia bacterium]|nr:SpoIIE family protein phosphatase [Thermoanaerobaculia bacterium]
MAARARFFLLLLLTLVVIFTTLGYTAGRARRWHERGWAGVSYMFGPAAKQQSQMMGLKEFEVLLTTSNGPADGKLLYRDEIISLNGIPRDDLKRLKALDERTRRGSTVVYHIRRQGKELDVPLRFESPLHTSFVLLRHAVAIVVALTFVSIALLIVARAPHDTRATVFFALALLSAVALLLGAATVYEQVNARGIMVSPTENLVPMYIGALATFMYPPLILHLGLIFPRRRPILERHPRVLHWIYAVAMMGMAALVMSVTVVLLIDWTDMAASEARMARVFKSFWYILVGTSMAVTVRILWAARREGIRHAIAQRPFLTSFATVGLIFGLSRTAGLYISPLARPIGTGVATALPLIVLCTFPIFALVALIRSHSEANAEEKRQVAWPLWGLLLTVGIKIVVVVLAGGLTLWITLSKRDFIQWRPLLEYVNLIPTVVTLAIPISFAVAIFKYRLMNIDVIIRKTVVYAILSGAIVVMYLGLVGGLGSFLVYAFGLENQTTMIIGSTLVVALIFVPLRSRLQLLVDRNLFRHKYDYPEALKAISAAARGATDANGLLAASAEQLQRVLQNRAVVIFAERQDEFVAVAKVGVADSLLGRLRVPTNVATALDRPFDPRRRSLDEETSAALARIEASLVVPAGTRAFIAAAPKLSNGEYDVEDIDFFRSAAELIATGIDRIRMQAEEVDFEQARQIQQTLLPREMPRVAGLDVSGVWQPARTMGGDYYDLIVLQESELAICIGDVAGKGMPAALLMSGLQAAVRASASNSPRDLCERVRRVVVSSLSGGRFVTFFYATVDTAAMKLRWCNAGHNAPILARADGTIVRLEEGGPAFSRLFRDAKYEERELDVAPGDRLVLFTDGVSEAADGAGEQFGESRIEELVTDCRDLSAAELQRTIVDAASGFSGGELEDDVTLVLVRLL